MRVKMRPWADETFTRDLEPSQQPRNRVAVSIGPTADGIDWASDGAIVLANRAVLPVLIPMLMFEPNLGKEYRVFETVAPHDAPPLADYLRIRWIGVVTHKHGAPGQVFVQKATTHVMDVIEVAVVRGTDSDDRLELRRATSSDLQ